MRSKEVLELKKVKVSNFLESFLKVDLYNKSEVEKWGNEFIKLGIIPNLKNLDIVEIFDHTKMKLIYLLKYDSIKGEVYIEEYLKKKYEIIRDDY